MTKDV